MKKILRKFYSLSVFVLLTIACYAQNDKQQFGQIDREDLVRKASLIDKNAEAEVLYENYDVSLALFAGHLQIDIKAHTRIKVYNEKGLDQANIKIPYIARSGAEGIYKLEAQTYNADASGKMLVSKVDKKSIYNKRINNRLSNQIFTFPEVKAGSIIEYSYTLKRSILYFDDWTFQRSIPVRYSNCTIEYPSEFSWSHVARTTLPIEIKETKSSYNVSKSFAMRNIPALKDEPFISCNQDYLQQVEFRLNGYYSPQLTINLSHTWPEILKGMMEDEDFGLQLSKKIPNTTELDQRLKSLTSQSSKMTAIHNYVRNTMAWDDSYSIWALDGVKHCWTDKKGNSAEINLVLVNLLRNAGLKAYPLLVSTKENGRVNTLYPSIQQFNTVMAVVSIDSSMYVLDATDKETPSHLIPRNVMYSEGLMISMEDFGKIFTPKDFSWMTIWNPSQKFDRITNMTAEIDVAGKIKGQAYIMNSQYARVASLQSFKRDNEKYAEKFTEVHAGLKLSDFKQKNEDRDSLPLEQQFGFELPADESGEYKYFSINMFSGLEKNPFIADERNSDILFGVNQKFALRGLFSIPEGYVFEELPKDVRMVMPDKSIVMTRYIQSVGNKVNYSVVIEFAQPFYPADDYPQFKEFYKRMLDMLNEQIVIKKS